MRETFQVVVSLPTGHKEDTRLAVEASLKLDFLVYSVQRVVSHEQAQDRRSFWWKLGHISGIRSDGTVVFEERKS